MTPATPTEITNLLGDVDPMVVEQILELGATTDEIAQAIACVEADRAGEIRIPMTTRVAAIYAIIEDAFDELVQDDQAYPAVG